jgi:hypothetical protein
MTAEPTRVYRLAITYPEVKDWGGVPRRHPVGWYPLCGAGCEEGSHDCWGYRWPREHLFLSRRGAEDRADLLRKLGCGVAVIRSLPVVWPDR